MKLIDSSDYKQMVKNIKKRQNRPARVSWLYLTCVIVSILTFTHLIVAEKYLPLACIVGITLILSAMFDHQFKRIRNPDMKYSLYRLMKVNIWYIAKLSVFSFMFIIMYVFMIEEFILYKLDDEYDINKSQFGK